MQIYVLDCIRQRKILNVDDYVEYWHSNENTGDLATFLGFTEEEFEKWVKEGNKVVFEILSKYKVFRTLDMDSKWHGSIIDSSKEITIRKGMQLYRIGETCELKFTDVVPKTLFVKITDNDYRPIRDINENDYKADGFDTLDELIKCLNFYYSDVVNEYTGVSIIKFEVIK